MQFYAQIASTAMLARPPSISTNFRMRSVSCDGRHVILAHQRAVYKTRDAIIGPGHLFMDHIQDGHVDEGARSQRGEDPLDQNRRLALEKALAHRAEPDPN